jgi:hypothetical protein
MATATVIAAPSETAARTASSPSPHSQHTPLPVRCLAASCLLAAALASAAAAQVPGMPADEKERAWYTSFMARFNARVLPSFRVDPEVQSRVAKVWEAMVLRVTGGRDRQPSPLEQYPLLSFVDDRFVVMKTQTPRGEETFVVRSDEALQMPTLSSTLVDYLDQTIYPSLQAIALEEKARIEQHPGYEPRLSQLAAQNPYQHGLPIRVPDLGPFKNRMVAFSGLGGRLSAAEVAEYEERKWNGGKGKVVTVMRPSRWGVAVELADLEVDGQLVCRYRLVREVAAVRDTYVGEKRRGVLLRQPHLGPVVEVSGCLADCDEAASWAPIFPEPGGARDEGQPVQRRSRPLPSPFEGSEPGLLSPS